jgi:hypothetical protein
MRKAWAAALAPLLAIAFMLLGTGPANAFGSEVLGCSVDSATWTASTCGGGGSLGDTDWITYSPHNLSGTYSYKWTITNSAGTAITASCSTTTGPCIYGGCTATQSTCTVQATTGKNDKTFTATLVLTQSGLSRTIKATATIYGDPLIICPYYPCP